MSMVTVVTGANSGVGYATGLLLAQRDHEVVLVCRDERRGASALQAIRESSGNDRLHLEIADLSRLDSVGSVVRRLRKRYDKVDLLVNNAGLYLARKQLSPSGIEMTMAINHVGHFALTMGLLDHLRAARGRVINVSSEAHRGGDLQRAPVADILTGAVRYDGFTAYRDSKLANVLFTCELARRERGTLTSVALHPGVLGTRIWNRNWDPASLIMRLVKVFLPSGMKGARAVVHAARDTDTTGVYYHLHTVCPANPQAQDMVLARSLWQETERLVK